MNLLANCYRLLPTVVVSIVMASLLSAQNLSDEMQARRGSSLKPDERETQNVNANTTSNFSVGFSNDVMVTPGVLSWIDNLTLTTEKRGSGEETEDSTGEAISIRSGYGDIKHSDKNTHNLIQRPLAKQVESRAKVLNDEGYKTGRNSKESAPSAWRIQKRNDGDDALTTLYVGGLFELSHTHADSGAAELASALLAIDHVNQQRFIPGYKLDMFHNDTQVNR